MKIVIRGVRSQSGFGVATIGLILLTYEAGHDVRFIPVDTLGKQDTIGINTDVLKFLNSITITEDDPFIKDSMFIEIGSLSYGYYCQRPKIVDKYILYTTTETTTINIAYVELFNSKFDEIWTASKFNRSGFFASGIIIPVHVLPHYVDTEKFNPNLKPYKIKNKRSFNFVVNIDFSYRKGLHLLIPAWMKAFKKQDDISLILKISDGDFTDPVKPIKSLNDLLFKLDYNRDNYAPILVMSSMIDGQYMPNLYTTGNIYLAPTLGEGFGYPIAEAMACGIPPVVSNCSAPNEYVTSKEGFLVHMNEKNPIQPITDESLLIRDANYKGRFLYNISVESLSEQLLRSCSTSIPDLKIMGDNARQAIIDKFSIKPLTKTLNTLLGE